jgi:hypothetical protein
MSRTPEALEVAVELTKNPATVREKSNARLPYGVTTVLAIAAGKERALREAQKITGKTEALLREAACFFIEQVLFTAEADSYRVLGAEPHAQRHELRQNMVLLMRWLHPDHQCYSNSAPHIDRSIYIHRVTQAWEDLKTDARRAAYDEKLQIQAWEAALQKKQTHTSFYHHTTDWHQIDSHHIVHAQRNQNAYRRLVVHRVASGSMLNRLLYKIMGTS